MTCPAFDPFNRQPLLPMAFGHPAQILPNKSRTTKTTRSAPSPLLG
jgi:hypothetical protein